MTNKSELHVEEQGRVLLDPASRQVLLGVPLGKNSVCACVTRTRDSHRTVDSHQVYRERLGRIMAADLHQSSQKHRQGR